MPRPTEVGVDPRRERQGAPGVAAVAAPAGVYRRSRDAEAGRLRPRSEVTHHLPVAGGAVADGVPALPLVVPHHLAPGHPVVEVLRIRQVRGDEPRVRVARVRVELDGDGSG